MRIYASVVSAGYRERRMLTIVRSIKGRYANGKERLNGEATGSNHDTDGFDWQTGNQEKKKKKKKKHDDEYCVKETRKPAAAQDLDLDEYRAGRPLKLANITALSGSQKIEIAGPRKNRVVSLPLYRGS